MSFTIKCRSLTHESSLSENYTLLANTWPKTGFSLEYLQWLYLKNPAGPTTLAEARNETGDLIGQAAFLSAAFLCPLSGLQQGTHCVNLVVSPTARNKGVFISLIKAFIESHPLCRFIIAVVNHHSYPGFSRRLGFKSLGPLEVRIGFGTPQYTPPQTPVFYRNWDPGTLKWRLENPNATYFLCPKSQNIWTAQGPFQILLKKNTDLPHTLKKRVLNALKPVVFIGQSTPGFFPLSLPIPTRFRPSPLYFVYKILEEVALGHKWKMEGLDLDTF